MSIHPSYLNHSAGPRDRGSAMILTLMVMALVTVLGTTVAVVSINNLQSSWRSRQAGAALSAADAGIAQAMAYLRSAGVRGLDCSPTCGTGNPWGDRAIPSSVPMPGAGKQSYATWIEPVAPSPQNNPGLYRIHSTGSAAGAASRSVTADVSVTTSSSAPKGVFARSVSGNGNASVTRQSVFSTGCVYGRKHIKMEGDTDLAYGIPPAVHSSEYITEDNGEGQYCSPGKKAVHASTACNDSYPYDQDKGGGLLKSGDGCHNTKMTGAGAWAKYYATYDVNSDGTKDPSSLMKTETDLFSIFGFGAAPSQGHLDTLRMTAQAQGTFFTSSSTWHSPTTTAKEVVMFFDLTKTDLGGLVDLKKIDDKFGRDPIRSTGAACPSKSLTIVVEGGNVRLNGNANLAATLILTSSAPYGKVQKANGNSDFIGTIYADEVEMAGNSDISLDECFIANAGPSMMNFAVTSYREKDRGLG